MAEVLPGDRLKGSLLAQRSSHLPQKLRPPRKVAVVQVILLVKAGSRHLNGNVHHRARPGHGASCPAADRIDPYCRVKTQRPLRAVDTFVMLAAQK